jgi:hypothetical protein
MVFGSALPTVLLAIIVMYTLGLRTTPPSWGS